MRNFGPADTGDKDSPLDICASCAATAPFSACSHICCSPTPQTRSRMPARSVGDMSCSSRQFVSSLPGRASDLACRSRRGTPTRAFSSGIVRYGAVSKFAPLDALAAGACPTDLLTYRCKCKPSDVTHAYRVFHFFINFPASSTLTTPACNTPVAEFVGLGEAFSRASRSLLRALDTSASANSLRVGFRVRARAFSGAAGGGSVGSNGAAMTGCVPWLPARRRQG